VVRSTHAKPEGQGLGVGEIDATLAALADPTRRAVIELLRARPRRPGELAESLRMSGPAMSRHLRILRRSGLVEEEGHPPEDARARLYRLRIKPFKALRRWVDEVETFWAGELQSFKSHVEKTRRARKARR
jgi:DNA-binding transcriptional ArsR family regulator